jgi:tetratricopeptide (TPR) repeat protein
MLVAMSAGIVALASSYVLAQDLPWKTGDPAKTPTGQPQVTPAPTEATAAAQPALDLEKVLTPELYLRAIKPILTLSEQADKALALYDKEIAKPENERNAKRAIEYRESAARLHLAASQKALQGKKMVPEPEYKEAIANQYELPLRDKAIALYTALAAECMAKKDFGRATTYYRQILRIDAGNATATEGLATIETALKAQSEAANKPAGASSGSPGGKTPQPVSRPPDSYVPDYTDKHAPADYMDRGTRQDKYR